LSLLAYMLHRAVSGIQDGVKITVDGKSLIRECPVGQRTQ
jgi:hypothetical protein